MDDFVGKTVEFRVLTKTGDNVVVTGKVHSRAFATREMECYGMVEGQSIYYVDANDGEYIRRVVPLSWIVSQEVIG